jgi:hypothetical protein
MARLTGSPFEMASLGANRATARASLDLWRRQRRLARQEAELHPGRRRTDAEDLAARRERLDGLLREAGRR